MKNKLTIVLTILLAIATHSCNKEMIDDSTNTFSYKKVRDRELEGKIYAFINEKHTKNLAVELLDMFDLSEQEILENRYLNKGVVLLKSLSKSDEQLIFYMDGNEIVEGLRLDIIEMRDNEYALFKCNNMDGSPIMKAEFDFLSNTYTVLELYDESKKPNWGCNLSVGTAGLLWTTAFSVVSGGAAAVVGVAFLVFQTWICQ